MSEKKKRNSPGVTIAESQVFCWHCQLRPAFALHQGGTHCEPRTPSLTLMLPVPTSAPHSEHMYLGIHRDHRIRLRVWVESGQWNERGLSWFSKCMWPEMLLESVHTSKSLLPQLTSPSESSLSMGSTVKRCVGNHALLTSVTLLRFNKSASGPPTTVFQRQWGKGYLFFSLFLCISITQTTATRPNSARRQIRHKV